MITNPNIDTIMWKLHFFISNICTINFYFITSYSKKIFCVKEIKASVCVIKEKGWRTSGMFESWWSFILYFMKSWRERRRVSLNERKISIAKPFNHYQSLFRAVFISFLSYYRVGFNFEFWQNIPPVKWNSR